LSQNGEDININKYYKSNSNIRRKSYGYDINNRTQYKRFMGKTKSTNFTLTGYNYFNNQTTPNETGYSHYHINNIKNENLISHSESQNSNLEEYINGANNINNNNYINNMTYNRTKSKFNSQSSIFSLNNNKSHNRSKNSTTKKYSKENSNKFNSKRNLLENNRKYSNKMSEESDKNKNINRESDDNYDFSVIFNLKKNDNSIMKNKLIKIYKSTMNEFLQKIKDEEKDLNNNSNRLSNLLYKFKKKGNIEKFRNRKIEIKKNKTSNTFNYSLKKERNSINSLNLKKNAGNSPEKSAQRPIAINLKTSNFYPSWGKSKYSIPYINKIVYGEENSLDPFEQLQKDLFFEVKKEIKKTNFINKKKGKKGIYINGKDILDRFKKNDSEIE
jgi:hypothetical protein